MRIGILSGGEGWHVRDLRRAIEARADTAAILDFRNLAAGLGDHQRDPFESLDALVVRTMPLGSLEQVIFRMDLLHAAESRGLRVLNPVRSLETCVDKYLACVRFQQIGLNVPATLVCQRAEDAIAAFEQLGGDIIVKPLFGSEGRGMMRVSDPDLAWRTFRTIERSQAVLYIQRFIPNPGWDLRLLVCGDRILGAMRRYARTGWRTNVAQGGHPQAVTPESEAVELAHRAANAVGTWVAGVDLMQANDGAWYLLEVNAVPGWKALAPTCGIDVADAVMGELARRLGR